MTTKSLAFCDLPDPIRFRLRDAIEEAGGYVAGYYGPFFRAMEEAGLELDEHSLHFFPLGMDQPPDHLRHQRGYWLYGNFSPRP
jgi:hypothetical protein